MLEPEPDALVARVGAQPVRALVVAAGIGRHCWSLVLAVQGPVRALASVVRLSRALSGSSAGALDRPPPRGRVVAVTIGMTVLAWTGSQIRTYRPGTGRGRPDPPDQGRGALGELAVEQGILAGLTPFARRRGPGGQPAVAAAWRRSCSSGLVDVRADWGGAYVGRSCSCVASTTSGSGVNLIWGSGCALLPLSAGVAGSRDPGDLPLGGCLMIEVPSIPPLDDVLRRAPCSPGSCVELPQREPGDTATTRSRPIAVVGMLPGARADLPAVLPARYAGHGRRLGPAHLPSGGDAVPGRVTLRWQLNWGLADVQGAALASPGLAGAVAWSRGTVGGALCGAIVRLLAAEGGHLLALLAPGRAGGRGSSGLAYVLVLSLPASTWVLAAADGYAHYATLPVGLLTVAALVELGSARSPRAPPAPAAAARSGPRSLPARRLRAHPSRLGMKLCLVLIGRSATTFRRGRTRKCSGRQGAVVESQRARVPGPAFG